MLYQHQSNSSRTAMDMDTHRCTDPSDSQKYTMTIRKSEASTPKDYDSAVRFLRDFYRQGSLRTALDVVLEEEEAMSTFRISPKVVSVPTCECLADLVMEDDETNDDGDDPTPSTSEDDDAAAWGFFMEDEREEPRRRQVSHNSSSA